MNLNIAKFSKNVFKNVSLTNTKPETKTIKPKKETYTFSDDNLSAISKNFKNLDTNDNGFVGKKELVNVLQDKTIQKKDAALYGTLLSYYDDVRKLSDDETFSESSGISQKDLEIADSKIESNEDGIKNKLRYEFNNRISKINSLDPSLRKPDNTLRAPQNASEIDYKDIEQGKNGNCYFLAALCGVAKENPQKIVDMINDNDDGTFTVTFGKNRKITIDSPTDTELGLYGQGKTWVPIMEKAYAKLRNQTQFKANDHDASGWGTIIIGRAIYTLTGNSFDTDDLPLTRQSTTRKKLINALENNKIITTNIMQESLTEKPSFMSKKVYETVSKASFIGQNKFELPDAHVYTVLDYDKETDMITIRNPWGSGQGNIRDENNSDGIFTISIDDFHSSFGMIAYEN